MSVSDATDMATSHCFAGDAESGETDRDTGTEVEFTKKLPASTFDTGVSKSTTTFASPVCVVAVFASGVNDPCRKANGANGPYSSVMGASDAAFSGDVVPLTTAKETLEAVKVEVSVTVTVYVVGDTLVTCTVLAALLDTAISNVPLETPVTASENTAVNVNCGATTGGV